MFLLYIIHVLPSSYYMRIPYIILETPVYLNTPICIPKTLAHYLVHVLRGKHNDLLTLANASGRYSAHLQLGTNTSAEILPIKQISPPPVIKQQIHLYQASCRSKKIELIIQKATELGVHSITIVNMTHCQVEHAMQAWQKKLPRYEEIALNASQQSKRFTIPLLHAPIYFDALPFNKNALNLAFHPDSTHTLRSLQPLNNTVNICIGPEGGLHETECASLQNKHFTFTQLGSNILRTETAAIAAIASCQTLWG